MKINENDYIVSEDELEEMGFKDIVVPNPVNFGLEEDTKELDRISPMYPFFAMDIESEGDPGFYESSSFDPEDFDSYNDPLS